MVAALKQVVIGGLDTDADETREAEAATVWRALLWSAMRSFVETYIDTNGMMKHDGVAFRLNKIWEPHGRPVTPGALRQALADAERNNFRLEWADWFAARSPEVAELMARRVKPIKTKDDYIAALETVIRSHLSHKDAEKWLREARML